MKPLCKVYKSNNKYNFVIFFLFFLMYILFFVNEEQSFVSQRYIFKNPPFQNNVPLPHSRRIRSLDYSEDEDSCNGNRVAPLGVVKIRKDCDIFKMDSFSFLPDYKNPCFKKNVTIKKTNEMDRTYEKLYCLPYFFIIGMPKSGTSDLWDKLSAHPDVYAKQKKEPMWFNRKRFGKHKFSDYLNHFAKATEVIERTLSPSTCHRILPYHHVITGEGTVDVSFDNSHWQELPGNEGCNEPRYTNPHYLRHILPDIKLIAMMRNPVDRVFSDYMYESQFFGYKKSIQDFHMSVLESMASHLNCRQHFTERGCAYNYSIESFKARLRVGMYSVFVADWLRVFPSEQMLFLLFEDYKRDSKKALRKVLKFLDLRPLTQSETNKVFSRPIPNTRSATDKQLGDMLPKTRYLLQEFYKPFNVKLASILENDKYLWNQ